MTYLISSILLLLPSYLIRFSIFSIPVTALEVIIYAVFIIGIFQAFKLGFRKVPLAIILPVGLLIIALIISTLIAPDKRVASGEFKGFFIDPMMVGWLLYQFIKKEEAGRLFGALILSGVFVSVHTIVLRILGHPTPDGRVIGIFGYSPNYLALFLAPIAVLSFSLGYKEILSKKKILTLAYLIGFLLMLLAIYFSGSRGGFLSVAAGVGTFIIIENWKVIRGRFSALVMIGILILVAFYTSWVFFRPNFSIDPSSGGRVATSNNVRWQIWQTSFELAFKNPQNAILGVGLGNYQNAFGELTKDRVNFPEFITPLALSPHNLFLMFYLSTGLLGLGAFIWPLVLFFKKALKDNFSIISPVITAVMISILIYGLIDTPYFKNDLSVIFWFIWGCAWLL